MDAQFIQDAIRIMARNSWYGVYVPEFTYGDKRIDAAIIDVHKRWVRGFEIKVSRADFLKDHKWQNYAEFTSSLCIVCPENLISGDEISKPFGLIWVDEQKYIKWIKKPKRFQRRDCYAWTLQYLRVIEKELPRLCMEISELKQQLKQKEKP